MADYCRAHPPPYAGRAVPPRRPSARPSEPTRPGTTAGRRRRGPALALAVAVAVAAVGACSGGQVDTLGESAAAYGYAGALIDPPIERPSLDLTTTDGQPYDFAEATRGELALLFFGYTSCPDICPVHLGILARSLEQLTGAGADATVVFVGTDPARDTPERTRAFLDQFDEDFVGLVGDPEALDGALAEMGLPPMTYTEPDEDGDYAAVHPSQIYVFTPDDQAHIVYTFGTRSQDWVKDLPRLATETWGAPAGEAAS